MVLSVLVEYSGNSEWVVTYMLELCGVRSLFIHERWVRFNDTARNQVIQLKDVSISSEGEMETENLRQADTSLGLDDPGIACRMAGSRSSC